MDDAYLDHLLDFDHGVVVKMRSVQLLTLLGDISLIGADKHTDRVSLGALRHRQGQ